MVKFLPSQDGTKILLKTPFSEKEAVKNILGRVWNPAAKMWEIPIENFEFALQVFPGAMVHPTVKQQAEAALAKGKRAIEIKNLEALDGNVEGLKLPLFPYQAVGKAFLDLLQAREGAVLAFDMGLGKSVTSIAEFLDLYNRGIVTNCLVVCPASLKYATWEKEIKKFTNLEYIIVEGNPILPEDREVLVVEEETDWVRDADGKRAFTWEPAYGNIEVWNVPPPSLVRVSEVSASPEDQIAFMASYGPLPFDPEQDLLVGPVVQNFEGVYYLEGFKFRRRTGEKKSYLRAGTGKMVEVVRRWSGKALREVQYQQTDRPFMVVNYELFLSDIAMMPKIDENWVVILDECHRIKNRKAQTTKNLLRHCKNAGRKYLLSGTPLENRLEELYAVMDFAREGLLGAWYKFKERYLLQDYFGSTAIPNPQTFPELKAKIAPVIMRRKKHEVLKELPPLLEQEYWVEMNETQKKLYDEIASGIVERLDAMEAGEVDPLTDEKYTYLDILAQLTRLQQVLDSPALVSKVFGKDFPPDSAKLTELDNILEDVNLHDNKVIIFSQYREMTEIIYNRLVQTLGVSAVRYIHGGVNNQLRGIYQADFQDKPEVRVMVLTTAGNYGLDLFEASYVICYDQLFNPQKMNQVISRAHRNGNRTGVTAIHMVTRNSYEERKLEILQAKKELFAAVIDDDAEMIEKILTLADIRRLVAA